jgi:hypothetical protein
MADGFLFLLDLAAAVYSAVDTAHGNRQQCALVAERVRRVMDELNRLSPGDQRQFSASPTGSALAQTLQAAAALCGQFERKSWLKRVLSSSEHAAQFADIQSRLDRVVADANLAATLGTATRQRAQEQDAADAHVLTAMLLSEQRAGFSNLAAGHGRRKSPKKREGLVVVREGRQSDCLSCLPFISYSWLRFVPAVAGMLDLGLVSLQDQGGLRSAGRCICMPIEIQ